MNLHPIPFDPADAPDHRISTVLGDGCDLKMSDKSYDIVFSNSVIEHVGDWAKQMAFAGEVRRVGKGLWIQTPARECPIEPHYMALFVHWLPREVQRRILRWLTPWGWIARPSKELIDESVDMIRLLTRKEMKALFPDCHLYTERILWVLPKSYVAYRRAAEKG